MYKFVAIFCSMFIVSSSSWAQSEIDYLDDRSDIRQEVQVGMQFDLSALALTGLAPASLYAGVVLPSGSAIWAGLTLDTALEAAAFSGRFTHWLSQGEVRPLWGVGAGLGFVGGDGVFMVSGLVGLEWFALEHVSIGGNTGLLLTLPTSEAGFATTYSSGILASLYY